MGPFFTSFLGPLGLETAYSLLGPGRWLLEEREGKAGRVGYVAAEIFREGGWLRGERKKRKSSTRKRGAEEFLRKERGKQIKKKKIKFSNKR